jgi:hypothetical protein
MKRIIIVLLATLLLCACQPTPETEFVVNKGDQSAMIDMAKGDGTDVVTAVGTEGGKELSAWDYSALYGIPERLTDSFSDREGKVTARIDAPIEVPTAPLPIVRVFAKDFNQETVTSIWNVLIGDTPMYEIVDEENLNRRTRIKEELEYLYSLLDDPEMMEAKLYASADEVKEDIARLQAEYKAAEDAAPKDPERVGGTLRRRGVGFYDKPDVTTQSGLWAISGDGSVRFEVNNPIDSDEPIYEHVDGGWNVIRNDKRATLLYRRSSPVSDVNTGSRPLFIPFGIAVSEDDPLREEAKGCLSYPPKEAADKVRAFLAQAGLSDEFEVACIRLENNAGTLYERNSDGTVPKPTHYAYHVECVRTVSGAPCCVSEANVRESRGGESTKTAYAPSWSYENMLFYLDDDGIYWFGWSTPLSVADTLTTFSQLKPFDEIVSIVKNRLPLLYVEDVNRLLETAENPPALPATELSIDRVTLGLWRIAEQDKLGQGLLVPAYCFYGTLQGMWSPDETPRVEYDDLLFVINAVDGSVIDPEKGY